MASVVKVHPTMFAQHLEPMQPMVRATALMETSLCSCRAPLLGTVIFELLKRNKLQLRMAPCLLGPNGPKLQS
eukprot:714216-Amphidinium_carterae.1